MTTPAPYASGARTPRYDGIIYADGTGLIPAAEGDLSTINTNTQLTPLPVDAGAAVLAVVKLTVQGSISSNVSYVVLQTSLGNADDQWIDVAWCNFTGITPGSAGAGIFVLSGGVAGANSFQQSRAVGSAPSGNSFNQFPLGGRIRIVGKTTVVATGSSSSSSSGHGIPWVTPGVLASIRVKIMGLR